MYPVEAAITLPEQEIIFRIRQLIGDTKETFVDDVENTLVCGGVSASGTLYQLQEPRGYPTNVYVNGIEFTDPTNPSVLGYKYLKFSSPTLVSGASITVIYEHFNHSDVEIIDTYDSSAYTYLTGQCNLNPADLGVDLLVLATAYVLLTKDLNNYIKSAVNLEDSDSRFDASRRPQYMMDLLKRISAELLTGIQAKAHCKMFNLPVYKVE